MPHNYAPEMTNSGLSPTQKVLVKDNCIPFVSGSVKFVQKPLSIMGIRGVNICPFLSQSVVHI